ncbi:MAG: hypothetical protein RL641_103 [Candidatus Parcubacteria bacterium]|jgi:SAM-dependent methyltransferase
METLKKTYRRVMEFVNKIKNRHSLSGDGERVDITFDVKIDTTHFDMYQMSHYKRYLFAVETIAQDAIVADFASGTGYGSILLAQKAKHVVGADINDKVIATIKKRYATFHNVEFQTADLLTLSFENTFDTIISFETIEHFKETDIAKLFAIYQKALRPGGTIIFSTPYMQEKTEVAVNMGFHFTFDIDEQKIADWLSTAGLTMVTCKYQNYETHNIVDSQEKKDFIICVVKK